MELSSILSGALDRFNSLGRKKSLEDGVFPAEINGGKKGKKWICGFASDFILPDDWETKKYYIAGYHENNPATDLYDPQYVSAMYLSDGTENGGHLLISIDAVGLLNNDVNKIRSSLAVFCRNAGISDISVFSTHDHAGIDTMGIWGRLPHSGKSAKFMSLLFSACYKCAIDAYKNRAEGRLYFGSIKVPDMQDDVRTPVVYSDTLSRFRFTPDNGGNDIYLINFAAHAESLQGCNSAISADYPGYMREKIKDECGADTVFANGAIGGMITMKIENEKELRETGRLPENTAEIGRTLAAFAMAVENEKELEPSVLYAKKEFTVEADNPVLTVACKIGILNTDSYTLPYSDRQHLKTELTYYEIGGIKILGIPGELFPELAYRGYLEAEESATGCGDELNPAPLTQICGDENLIVIGLCNDEIGYIIPPNDFILNEAAPYLDKAVDVHGRRHYEETNSVGPETANSVSGAFGQLLFELDKYKQEERL